MREERREDKITEDERRRRADTKEKRGEKMNRRSPK